MKKQLEIWQFIHNSLEQDIAVMLLYVLQSHGSSPGRQGFFMAVNAVGNMQGSIGGGIMEYKFVEMAKEKLKQHEHELIVRRQLHDKAASKDQSGMICSGEQTILLYRVKKADAVFIENIIRCLHEYKNGLLQLSPAGLYFSSDTVPDDDHYFSMQSEAEWLYKEKLGYINHLYIVGGGHCCLALSKLMRMMDFYIHVYDDRSNLPTFLENEYAHEKQIVDDYTQLKEMIPPGDHHYVVIMTVGYRTDDIVLRSLTGKKFKYFGLLGSKTKIEKMFSDYDAEGLVVQSLQKIHAPVGLAIKSQTPEEIAVSIAAEIIQVKNEDFGRD